MAYPIFAGFIAANLPTDRPPPCVVAAHELAELFDGPLAVAVGALEITTPVIFSRASVGGLIGAENKHSREQAEAMRAMLKADRHLAGRLAACDIVHGELSAIRAGLASRARLYGFVVTQCGIAGDLMQSAAVETLLFETGRPVLIVPRGHQASLSLDTVLIAWDGGQTGARAAWNALPFLTRAKRVIIVSVTGEKDLGGKLLGADIAQSMKGAGLNVEARTLALSEPTVADLLARTARETSAGLIVLGAYGHSRWREFVFGGVTRDMLRHSEVPLLMSN
jgi:nucleotide-binding universal stress UspA family protein